MAAFPEAKKYDDTLLVCHACIAQVIGQIEEALHEPVGIDDIVNCRFFMLKNYDAV